MKTFLAPFTVQTMYQNIRLNEYFPKSINTKPKNDQGKSYSDRTNKQRDKEKERRQKDIENYNIDSCY